MLLFHPVDKTDDMMMKLQLSGAMSGQVDTHLVYVNYFLSCVLSLLQRLFPGVAWLQVSQVVTVFLSLTAFTYVMWQPAKKAYSALITMPVLLYFGFEGYVKITFTKTAGIAVGVGLLLVLMGLRAKERQKKTVICGVLLTLLGCLFRGKIIGSMLPFFLAAVALDIFNQWWVERKLDWKKLRPVLVLALIFVLTLAERYGGQFLFTRDSGWADYKEYNKYKVELQDYGWPDYEEYRQAYERLGISENDYQMWVNRDYGDPDRFTLELMASVVEMKDKLTFGDYIQKLPEFLRAYPMDLTDLNVFLPLLFLGFLLLISKRDQKLLPLLLLFVVIMLLYFYLYCSGRYGRQHVDVTLMFGASMYLCHQLRQTDLDKQKVALAAAVMLVLTMEANRDFRTYIRRDTYTGTKYNITVEEAQHAMARIKNNPENLYLISNYEYSGLLRAYDTFEAPAAGELGNVFIFQTYAYPDYRSVIERRDIRNIYTHICDGNCYYVSSSKDGNVKTILSYVQEHYAPDAAYEEVSSEDGVKVFRFYRDTTPASTQKQS